MILPDVNVLIYAFRPDAHHHPVCKAWLDNIILGEARLGISRVALAAVVRITTNVAPTRRPVRTRTRSDSARTSSASPHCQVVERASGTGTSSGGSASRPTRAGRASPTRGSRRSRSNGAASGSHSIATTARSLAKVAGAGCAGALTFSYATHCVQ